MAVNFLDNIDLNGNQLLNARLEVLASDPGSANSGDIIYNSTSNVFKYYNGSSWVDPSTGSYTSWTLQGDSGVNQTITDGTTVDWVGSEGIITATASNSLEISVAAATSTTKGGVELFSDTVQTVAASAVSTTASRTYGLQLNSAGQAVVNVPWSDSATGEFGLAGDSGSTQTIDVGAGDTATIAGGTGISTAAGATDTVTITNTDITSIALESTSGSNSTIVHDGTIKISAGAGITTTGDGSGQVTIAATGSGSMSSFTLTGDSGSNQTISDGNTLDVAGGTNISTVVGATDTVTVNLDDSVTLAGTLTVSGTGQSSFGGQVTVPTTPVATTDAASKSYVDASVVGNLIFQGGYNAATNTPDLDSSPSASIKKGWSYVVTAAGSFFTETVEVGDFLISQQDAPTTLANWVTVQNNTGLATVSTVGIGNVNVSGAGANAGLTLGYSSGTATVGVDIKNQTAATAIGEMLFLVHDEADTGNNVKVTIDSMNTYFAGNTGKQFVGTSSSATTHTFNHNLNSFNVIVQLYDTSSKETVYASVDRTSVNQVVATTASAASLTCLIDKIG